jgi:hypothetical protein
VSVDFHIPRRRSILVADLKRRARELLMLLGGPADVPIGIRIAPEERSRHSEPQEVGEVEEGYRIDLGDKTHVLLTYFPSGPRQVYLVSLAVQRTPINVLWATVIGEAVCDLGGEGIDDEGFISDGAVDSEGLLPPGRLIQLLRRNRPTVLNDAVKGMLREPHST